jgi:hypothetical protein
MKSSDIPKVEEHLAEMDDVVRRIKAEIRELGEVVERLAETCGGEPELLRIISKERRYFQTLRHLIDDFPIIGKIKRRLPIVESRLRRQEREGREENRQITREAADVRNSLEEILRRFLG